jgi:cytoskeletal protein CcmA (bactofilin family)
MRRRRYTLAQNADMRVAGRAGTIAICFIVLDRLHSSLVANIAANLPMTTTPNRRLTDRHSSSPTLIGTGSTFTGNFDCGGDLVVAGNIIGNSRIAGALTLADTGHWQGDIVASSAIVAGETRGNITITDCLEIRKSARIRGTIRAKTIAIATGAVVDGDMAVTSNIPVVHFDEKRNP